MKAYLAELKQLAVFGGVFTNKPITAISSYDTVPITHNIRKELEGPLPNVRTALRSACLFYEMQILYLRFFVYFFVYKTEFFVFKTILKSRSKMDLYPRDCLGRVDLVL